jgi:hypothetical protein
MVVLTLSKSSRAALLSVGLLCLSIGAASAATVSKTSADTSFVPSADHGADMSAKADLGKAVAALTGQRVKVGRDRLERAETALLNREVIDLGTALKADQPLPASGPVTHIVNARASLDQHNVSQAVHEAKQAIMAINTELAMAPSR